MTSLKFCLYLLVAIWSWITRGIPKRFLRLLIINVFSAISILTFITLKTSFRHSSDGLDNRGGPIVHGKYVSPSSEPPYLLEPFPASPMLFSPDAPPDDRPGNPWLISVICSAADAERRMMIRSTWMRLFRHLPFDGRFVVSNPGPTWTEMIRFENRTFGDLIVLDHLQEDDVTANTIKTLELYKWLVKHGQGYQWVTKMDTDLWLNAPAFWDRFLLPRMSNETGKLTANVERTVFGELYYSKKARLVFPHGSMYTMSRDLMQSLASLQTQFNVVTGEDMAVSILLHKSALHVNFVNFQGTEKFDFDKKDSRQDGTAWARERTHPNATKHALYGSEVIAVHELKEKKVFMSVADCFDETGIKPMPPMTSPDRLPPLELRWHDFWQSAGMMKPYESRFDRIPDSMFNYGNGTWTCNEVWNLGSTKTGYQALV